MRCKTCQYSLEGLTENRCPECGKVFDPNDPDTYSVPRNWKPIWIPMLIIAFTAFVGLFALCFAFAADPPPWPVRSPESLGMRMLRALDGSMTAWPFAFFLAVFGYFMLVLPTIRRIESRYRRVK